MPLVRVRRRKRIRKFNLMAISRLVRNMLLVIFLSLAAGKTILIFINVFSPPASTSQQDLQRQQVISDYKTKWGDEWKKKLLADYGAYAQR